MTEDKPIKNRPGRPTGIPRNGRYGKGVKTRVVRVPETVADNIAEILAKFEQIKFFVDEWDKTIIEASENSKSGKPSPRYDKAMVMLKELRGYLGE
jgi:hypothetical protein